MSLGKRIDDVIGVLAPGWQAKRARARLQVTQYQAAYDAAKPPRSRPSKQSRGSADVVTGQAGPRLWQQARYLEENHDLAKGVIDVLVGNIVGKGIQVDPQIRTTNGDLAEDLNRQLREMYDRWGRSPDVTGEMDIGQIWRMSLRTALRDGEVFSQIVQGHAAGIRHTGKVPMSLELFEPDFVPLDLYDDRRGIIQGVEKNKWGRTRAFHVYKEHPGNRQPLHSTLSMDPRSYRRIPADRMLHIKFCNRLHQTRGISILAPVMTRLDDIHDYEESERVAARVAAALTGYIKKQDQPGPMSAPDDDEPRTFSLEPGMVFDTLRPGEDVGTIKSERPNSQLWEFRKSQIQAVAAGTGASYSSSARDYDGSYSSQRQELVEQWSQTYLPLRAWFIAHGPRPVWERFVEMAVRSGAVEIPPDVDRDTLYNADFRGPAMPWIDPQDEAEAAVTATRAGFTSRRQVIRERGDSPSDVTREIIRDRQQTADAGLVLSSDDGSQEKA